MQAKPVKEIEEMNYFELIAFLGVGSSHPGGFIATKQNLQLLDVKQTDYVLDVGCGTGLTACFLAKAIGCKVIGIDIHPVMIERAKERAEKERLGDLVQFQTADIFALPFPANTFDLVLAESLTVFLDKVKVYRHVYRVLKPGGRLADLEMSIVKELPPEVDQQLQAYYGPNVHPLSFEGWKKAIEQAGLEYTGILNPQYVRINVSALLQEVKRDWVFIKQLVKNAKEHPEVVGRIQKNAEFMRKNHGYFGYGMITGRKPVNRSVFRRLRDVMAP